MERIKLEAKGVSIDFPGIRALSNVNFAIETGSIHAVVGANGAGKSTLMKVFSGANPSYTGEILYNGKRVELRKPMAAKELGIQTVYQEVDTALIPSLSVAENIMLNYMVMGMGHKQFMNWPAMRREAKKVLERLNITNIDPSALVGSLSLAQKQIVLIARAVQSSCNFLILDEPTAPLSDVETEELFKLCRHLLETENIAIIFISHRLNEVMQICSSYTVMRNGEIVDRSPITEETTVDKIVEKMLGRSLTESFSKGAPTAGERVFEVESLSDTEGKVNCVSLYARRGEIVGIAGLVGAGKSELCKTIFGALRKSAGTVKLNGQALKIKTPSDAVKLGIGLVPEERRKEGVLVSESVDFNLSAASLSEFCRFSFISKGKTRENALKHVDALSIKTPSIHQFVRNLSGGNQQKVAVGKWLAADCDVYIFDEPTKGVDVGAKAEIFKLISEIAENQHCVIYASCENSELLSITDRIYVMYDGKIMAELETSRASEDEIMHYAVGGEKHKYQAGAKVSAEGESR